MAGSGAVLPEPSTTVAVPGGRHLACDDVGDPGGTPVLYLHGAPDCRLARHPDDGIAARLGIRLVAVDRPGWGASDPMPAPDVLTWGADVAVLLDHLGIERCALAAWSAGAPWAFGVAAALPGRVRRVVTYGAVAPLEAFDDEAVVAASGSRAGVVEELAGGTSLPEVCEGLAAMLVPAEPVGADLALAMVRESYPPAALAEVQSVPGQLEQLARSLAAADRHGTAGLSADLTVQYDPGMVEVLAGVGCPVVLVHGDRDDLAGPAVGRWLAGHLPDATVAVWDRGHQGLLPDWARWLGLCAQWAQ